MERKVLQAHAYTVKLLPTGWVLLDSYFDEPLYQNPSRGQQRWDIKKFFKNVVGSDVYVLREDEMSQEKFEKSFNKLRRVLTQSFEDIKERQRMGMMKTNKKRKSGLISSRKQSRTSK